MRRFIGKRWLALAAAMACGLFLSGNVLAETLTMAAVGTTSDQYMLAVGWSGVMKKIASPVEITPLEGGGTVKLLRGVATGKWDIGFIAAPHYANALDGTLQFEKDPPEFREKYKDIRSLFGITSGMGQYVVRADSGIAAIPELKGKKVAIGAPGGMAGTVTQALFLEHGLKPKEDYQPEYLDYSTAMDEMRNNRIDCALAWGGVPQAAIYNFSRQIPVRFLPIDPAAFQAFKKKIPQGEYYVLRNYSPEDLKKGYGDGVKQQKDAKMWTFQMQVVVRADMPEKTAYTIVKAFWENLDQIKETGAALTKLNKEESLTDLSAKLHPGASAYYREVGWIK